MNFNSSAVFFTLLFSISSSLEAAGPYKVTDLGDFSGGADGSFAYDMNDSGQVVGWSEATTGRRAFLWEAGSGLQNLGDLTGGDDFSEATAINNNGHVVGNSSATRGPRAFYWNSATGMQNLADLDEVNRSLQATDINDNDLITLYGQTGYTSTGNSSFVITPGGPLAWLLRSPPSVYKVISANALNNSATIVGSSGFTYGLGDQEGVHPVRWVTSTSSPQQPPRRWNLNTSGH